MTTRPFVALALALACALAAGCATTHAKHVPIEARPTPPQPGQAAPAPKHRQARHATATAARTAERQHGRLSADTLAVRAAMRRCAGRKLLPEQESTIDGLNGQLAEVRAALARGELARAESLAREARSLASSLACP